MSYTQYRNLGLSNLNSRLEQQYTNFNIVHIETKEQKEKLIRENKVVCVDVFANWCGPCKAIENSYNELSQKISSVVFAKEDCDLNITSGVSTIPAFFIFVNGSLYKNIVGADLKVIENILTSVSPQQQNIPSHSSNQEEQYHYKNTATD